MILVAIPFVEELSLRELEQRLRELVYVRDEVDDSKYHRSVRRGIGTTVEDILIHRLVRQISKLNPDEK